MTFLFYFFAGCANCSALEEQLKLKTQEIERLQEGMPFLNTVTVVRILLEIN